MVEWKYQRVLPQRLCMPSVLLDNKNAGLIYALLEVWQQDGEVYTTYDEIAYYLLIHRNTVRRAIRYLADKGFIKVWYVVGKGIKVQLSGDTL